MDAARLVSAHAAQQAGASKQLQAASRRSVDSCLSASTTYTEVPPPSQGAETASNMTSTTCSLRQTITNTWH